MMSHDFPKFLKICLIGIAIIAVKKKWESVRFGLYEAKNSLLSC